MSQDPYCYPGSDVLRNLFAIHDEEQLKATEARVAAVALFVLEDEPLVGSMDEKRLKLTHQAIFSQIYDWAGTYREGVGRMTKGRLAGYQMTYCDSQFVPTEMLRIFAELATEDYLRGLEHENFAKRLAYFYSEMDAAHPFREGNSRTLRQFSADLCLSAGYELDWEPTGRTEESRGSLYLARDLAVNRRGYEPLLNIMRPNLRVLAP